MWPFLNQKKLGYETLSADLLPEILMMKKHC